MQLHARPRSVLRPAMAASTSAASSHYKLSSAGLYITAVTQLLLTNSMPRSTDSGTHNIQRSCAQKLTRHCTASTRRRMRECWAHTRLQPAASRPHPGRSMSTGCLVLDVASSTLLAGVSATQELVCIIESLQSCVHNEHTFFNSSHTI